MKGQSVGLLGGWIAKYKTNRPLCESEIQARLDPKNSIDLPPVANGIYRLNSVFAEYVDRSFFLRGYAAMAGLPIAVFTVWAIIMLLGLSSKPLYSGEMPSRGAVVMVYVFSFLFFSLLLLTVKYLLCRDFFCYTHYPIRFNRMLKKVYVFRGGGRRGVGVVYWDKAHWFIGAVKEGKSQSYELRCHSLTVDHVVDFTFSVGNSRATKAEVLEHWEMIRRYMEGSPADLPFPPLALVLSTEVTWRNCVTLQVGGLSGHSAAFMVLTIPWAFFRWISQITCRRPRWPDEVEAQSQISIDDPYRLPEPASSGEIVGLDEVAVAALFEYREKAEAAALAYEAAASVQIPSH